MTTYTVIFEREESSWGAYLPELPGCTSAARTREEADDLIRDAIALHIAGLREDGDPVQPPTTEAALVTVPA